MWVCAGSPRVGGGGSCAAESGEGRRFVPRQDGFSAIFRHLRARLPADIDFKLHRARNTAITNWLSAGVDLRTTMRLAGHKSPKVTDRYAGTFTDEELAQVTRPAFSLIYGKKAVWSPDESPRSNWVSHPASRCENHQ